jgi:ABC-type spermidine/putrescine transport system permease subunit I
VTDAAQLSDAAYRAQRLSQTRRRAMASWLLMLPALFIVLVFFGIPTLYMARMSFNLHIDQRLYVPGFTFEHYANLFSNPLFTNAIWTTVKLALMGSLATVAIGYGFALLVWLKPARWRLLFIGLALCPLLISEIAIIFGWWMFFPKNGLLSHALLSMGIIQDRISLMYTEFAAFVGLVYVTLPYCFFILLSIFDGIDKRLLEASADLGAPPMRTFNEVLLPLTWTGILVAFSQSFIWTMGTYATPSALGPDTLWTMGFLIQEQMLGKHNWPMASALAVVLVVGVAAVMLVTRGLQSKRTSFHV